MSGVRAGADPLPTPRAQFRARRLGPLRLPAPAASPGVPLRAILLLLPLLAAGCTSEGTPGSPPESPATAEPSTAEPSRPDARAELAALAAAAQDRHLVASHRLSASGRPDRTVRVIAARDGTWRVDIAGGALGGTADVSVARTADGIYQCALPSAERPDLTGCVRVAEPDGRIPAAIDPQVHHPFTDWHEVLTNRRAPLSVSESKPLPGVTGRCFAVDSTSASLSPPLDVGIYCYQADGTLSGARLGYGTLVLASTPTAGPATVRLPGPVVQREPLGLEAPPPTTAAEPSA